MKEELELIQGVRRLSSQPLAQAPELVKATTAPPPAAQPVPPRDISEEVAQIRREIGQYAAVYTGLQVKIPALKLKERGGENAAGFMDPPDGKARGRREAIEGILVALKPLVEGTASNPKSYAAGMRTEMQRRCAEEKKAAEGGDVASFGRWEELSSFLKMV
ncbi:hypothetical protein [Luteolibacter sp. Populi]|uniref:hypothetical protein n=1 Tax=Luteolibacter sp. Populi TaxID=3230487 RepID=UPI003467EA1C